jgi:hypothetical protein
MRRLGRRRRIGLLLSRRFLGRVRRTAIFCHWIVIAVVGAITPLIAHLRWPPLDICRGHNRAVFCGSLFDRRCTGAITVRDIHAPLQSFGRCRDLICRRLRRVFWRLFLGRRRRDGILIGTIAPLVAHLHSPLLDICRWHSRGLI